VVKAVTHIVLDNTLLRASHYDDCHTNYHTLTNSWGIMVRYGTPDNRASELQKVVLAKKGEFVSGSFHIG